MKNCIIQFDTQLLGFSHIVDANFKERVHVQDTMRSFEVYSVSFEVVQEGRKN